MSNQVNSMNKGLTVKDLVTTGIFTALLFVFVLVVRYGYALGFCAGLSDYGDCR